MALLEVKQCAWCGSAFTVWPSNPQSKCCSRSCAGKYRRSQPAEIRFWPKVAKAGPDECWPWQGATNQDGYGVFWNDGVLVTAHRMARMLTNGPIPKDMGVLHKCDNRLCCNPNHFFLGTSTDNGRDCTAKNRRAKGEKHGKSKITEAQALEILARNKAGEGYVKLAEAFQVSRSAIKHLVKGKNWAHLPGRSQIQSP